MCNIKAESNVIPEKPKFTLSKEDGVQKLQIVFPEESEELLEIHQSDEYDYSVPDLEVSVDVELGVVCGRGRNPTLRLWPAIFSGEIDVFPSERRNMGQEIGR